jgi:DNA-binding IclR family transcriptional regulator
MNMPAFEEVLQRIEAGHDARQIMKELGLAPSKLRRVLNGMQMYRYLSVQRETAMATLSLRLTAMATSLPERLHKIASESEGEVGRRACLSLLEQVMRVINPQKA